MSNNPGNRMDGLLTRWTGAVTARSVWVVLLATLASAAALFVAARRLTINTDPANMIASDLPFRLVAAKCKELFPQYSNSLLIVVDAGTPEAARTAANDLLAGLKSRPELFQAAYLPAGGPFLESHGLLFLPPAELAKMGDQLALAQPFLAALARDPSLRGLCNLLGKAITAANMGLTLDLTPLLRRINDGLEAARTGKPYALSWQELMGGADSTVNERRQLILAQPKLDASQMLPAAPAMQAIRQLADKLGAGSAPGLRVRITGEVALSHEEMVSVFNGTRMAGILSMVMVCLTLLIGLRSWRLTLITLVTLVMGLALIAGFAAVTVGRLNLISIAFAVLYIGLGVDYAIYLCLSYRVNIEQGHASPQALQRSMREVGLSLIMCAVSTAIAFYAFIPTAYKGVSELGLIAGTGMLVSLLISLAVVPALLTLWPLRLKASPAGDTADGLTRFLFHLTPRRRRLIHGLTLVVTVGGLFVLPRVRFDYNPFNLRDPASESIATLNDLIGAKTITPWTIVVLAHDAATAQSTAARIGQLSSVDKVVTVNDFVPPEQDKKMATIADLRMLLGPETLQPPAAAPPAPAEQIAALNELSAKLKNFTPPDGDEAGRQAFARLGQNLQALVDTLKAAAPPQQQALLSRLQGDLLGLLPQTLNSLSTVLNAAPFGQGDLPPDLRERWLSPSGVYRIEVLPKGDVSGEAALRHFVSQVRTVAPEATGDAIDLLESGDAVVKSFQHAFLGALVAIILILLVAMRSLGDTILVLFPLVLTGILTGAATVLLHLPFNFANVITLPLLLGTGIESGIQVVQRMHRNAPRRGGQLPRGSTAQGIIYCTLTTIFSFGNLGLTAHRGMASMGQLLTLGVVFALLTNLVILPAFLSGTKR